MQSIYTPSRIQDWYREDKILAGKDRRYSLRPWIPCTRNTKIQKTLIWPNHVLHLTRKVESVSRHGRHTACWAERIEVPSNKVERNHPLRHSQLIVSRKLLWWNLKKSYTRKRTCHLEHHRRFLTKIIGRAIWILILLEDAARTSNESNWNPIPNYQVQGNLSLDGEKNLWKRTKFDRDTLNQEKHDEVTISTSTVKPLSGHKSTKRCVLTPRHVEDDQTGTERPVLVDQKRGTQIWFQSTRTVHTPLWSRTSPSSRACITDRESSSTSSTSSRLAAE